MRIRTSKTQDGSILVSILVVTLFLAVVIGGLVVLANSNITRARGRILLLQAQYAAESGVDSAVAQLNDGNDTYTGSGSEVELLTNSLYRSTFSVSVAAGADSREKVITATGKVYVPATATTARFSRSIEVVAQRSSSATSTSILSRNIINIDSGVKDINAKDVFLNGYIYMNKNTTTLIAENITVAGKNTGAANCSIDGPGNLEKPTSFVDPGQTKTTITTAYNNCVSPPGNTTDTDFTVSANDTTITKVQSTYIPWSQYMDSSYQNSPGGCNDWTSGASPRDIPSTGNTKKTHYPNNSSNISTSCGTSGNLNLGTATYNIRDHVHVRANFCATSACHPTFYNPDAGSAGIKFVFVEGTVNFDGIQTAAGSGPIVMVIYGADPGTFSGFCPLGDALHLGKDDITQAPALYFVVNNGACFDKTKFSTDPSLGGISAKNLYIATNSGTPFDLGLDTGFPTNAIPIDLAWRAVRYRRL